MAILMVILVFVAVALMVFAGGMVWDQRRAQARLLRERLASVQKAAEREPNEELALLRDEMLSQIPALDNLLRRHPALVDRLERPCGGQFVRMNHHFHVA